MLVLPALAIAAGLFSDLALGLSAADIPSDTPISALLASAQSHLSKGETSDALLYYDAAIARDPNDYLTFFKRATTYLSLGRTTQASDDFNKVLSLKPGFESAHVHLGKIKARSADWQAAREQFSLAKSAAKDLAELEEAHGAALLAEAAEKSGKWDECVEQAGIAIAIATRAVSLREIRARCRFETGEMELAMADLNQIQHLKPGDTTPLVKISAITFFALGNVQEGMAAIRKCLHSDPDSKRCKKLLKQEKAIDKTLQKVTKALEKNQHMGAVRQLLPTDDSTGLIQEVRDAVKDLHEDGTIPKNAKIALESRLVGMACQAYYESNSKKAKDWCEESLKLDENSFYAILYKAKVLMDAAEYEASINMLNKAGEVRSDMGNVINPLLQKAQVALKRSKNKDYYKVLGVAHDADERQIKSAYRKLTKLHHPDKAVKQGLTKEEAEKKMAAINEAYEVLSDPELRARFDRGDDPNSHEQQHPFQQGSPFGGGGHPFMFQQGGGQFKFQFGSNGFPFG